jgi:hypothetical protein
MLAVIIAAGLSPNTGAVPAQSNCQYNQCVGGTSIPWWVLGAIVVAVVAALLIALLLMRRRRRPPAAPVRPYVAPGAGPAGGAPAAAPAPTGPAPPYLETAEDVGAAPPAVPAGGPPAGAVGGAAAGAAAGKAAEEPDIDSLMAELDKISSEILKRPKPPSGSTGNSGGPAS